MDAFVMGDAPPEPKEALLSGANHPALPPISSRAERASPSS
jgi:hypothetical protein